MYKAHIKQALDKLSSFENTCCLEFVTSFGKGEELVLDTFEEVLEETGIQQPDKSFMLISNYILLD